MAGIGDSTLFPNSKMAAAAQLGQSRFRSGEITSIAGSGGTPAAYPPSALVAWPDATNTGVPAFTQLMPISGDVNSTGVGQTIDKLFVTGGTIFVNHNNVTVQRCKVDTTGSYCIRVMPGVTGCVIRDCDLLNAQDGVRGAPATMTRCNVHAIENGVTVAGGNNITILDNYIHDFFQPVDPHYDGIAAQGGCNNVTVQHNTINNGFAQTSCVFFTDEFGAATTLKILNNQLIGGGYNIIVGGPGLTAVTVQNNLLTMGIGFYSTTTPAGQMIFSGNVSNNGIYLDGDVPPVVGTVAFQPTNPVTSASDQNANTSFRVNATLSQPIASQFRLVFYTGSLNSMGLDAAAFGKASSGQTSTAVLQPVLFGGVTGIPSYAVPTSHYIVSDWTSPGGLSFAAGNGFMVGFSMRNLGGTGISSANSNVNSYFGATANMTNTNPGYTAIANGCYALVRIETQ